MSVGGEFLDLGRILGPGNGFAVCHGARGTGDSVATVTESPFLKLCCLAAGCLEGIFSIPIGRKRHRFSPDFWGGVIRGVG